MSNGKARVKLTPEQLAYEERVLGNGYARLLEGYLSREEMARQLDVHVRTLKRWDDLNIGPPVTYLGRVPFYNVASFRRWFAEQERDRAKTRTPEPRRPGRPRRSTGTDRGSATFLSPRRPR
jgi:hypothetical protein